MDYLDPRKKKLKRMRILIGYFLMGIAITIATVVMVYLANGYYIDNETGTVIQNGLVYVDSKPESAEVYLNGEKQRGSTDARLVVPEGKYVIELKRDGYRPWSRTINLEGGNLRRLTYARLIPETLDSEPALSLPINPTMVTQSIDKRWLVVATNDNRIRMRFVDLESSTLAVQELPLPLDLLITKDAGVWSAIEWADDNKTFLASYTTETTAEYVLIDRDDPTNSRNIATVFPDAIFTSVSMRNRKKDLVFIHDKISGNVSKANVSSGIVEPYLTDVTQYVAFGNDSVLYVTSVGATEGFVKVVLRNGDDELLIREIKQSEMYLLEMSKLGNALVMGIGSPPENRVIVYNDPINALRSNDFSTMPVATTVLRVENPQELSISADSSVILARSGQSIASHEFEADRSYNFKLDSAIDEGKKLVWVDGQHITYSTNGMQYMMDFDGSNTYELVASLPSLGSFFDRNTDLIYTFSIPVVDPASEEPAPVQTTQMIRTFMRSEADR